MQENNRQQNGRRRNTQATTFEEIKRQYDKMLKEGERLFPNDGDEHVCSDDDDGDCNYYNSS